MSTSKDTETNSGTSSLNYRLLRIAISALKRIESQVSGNPSQIAKEALKQIDQIIKEKNESI